jgi:hypothetical protein
MYAQGNNIFKKFYKITARAHEIFADELYVIPFQGRSTSVIC